MKNLLKKFFTVSGLLFVILAFFIGTSLAITVQECEQKIDELHNNKEEAEECKIIFNNLAQQKTSEGITLNNEINRLNKDIAITSSKILLTIKEVENLEKEIASLNGKITTLDLSLDQLSEILLKRIAETYKKGKVNFVGLFLSSDSFSDFISRYKYLKVVQLHDRNLMLQMETARTNFEDQKALKEQKQEELELAKKKLALQKAYLDQQRKDKEYLLQITKNDEKRYQELLSRTRTELDAILGILAGKGNCQEVGKVNEGQRIASVIQGKSCNSSGSHLHFMIIEGSGAKNPFSYLSSVEYKNCSGYSCDSGDGDPFNPSGSWRWPINSPITFSQGYGNTWAIQHYSWLRNIYTFHNGIDINSDSTEVKAVKSGTLYKCSYYGSNSCILPYVELKHDDSNFSTLYLHVNY